MGFQSVHGKLDGLASEVSQLKQELATMSKKQFVVSMVAVGDTGDSGLDGGDSHEEAPTSAPPARKEAALHMRRHLRTVTDVWTEYTKGIGGQMAVQRGDELFGAQWRSLPKDNKCYSRRKVFYDVIKAFAAKHCISTEAVLRVVKK